MYTLRAQRKDSIFTLYSLRFLSCELRATHVVAQVSQCFTQPISPHIHLRV
jgi:hypothetical protein